MLALDRNQKLLTVWRRDRSVFSAEPESISEAFIGVGEQPWIANSSDGFYIVWTSKRSGDLLLLAPGSSNSERLGSDASYPIVTSAIRSESVVYAFWEKQSGKDFSILARDSSKSVGTSMAIQKQWCTYCGNCRWQNAAKFGLLRSTPTAMILSRFALTKVRTSS